MKPTAKPSVIKNKVTDKKVEAKSEMEIAKKLAQKEYDQKVMKVLERNERILMNENDEDLTHQLVDVFQRMSEAKQVLIKPYVLSDEEYLENWLEEHKGGQNGYSIANGFLQ